MPGNAGSCDGIGTVARFENPSIIKVNNGEGFLIDGNLIRSFNVSNLKVTTIYMSTNTIVDLAMGGGSIYILELIK